MKDTGGPAFPQSLLAWQDRIITAWEWGFGGITTRDYFAGKVVMGLTAHYGSADHPAIRAEIAYQIADAMMEERKK